MAGGPGVCAFIEAAAVNRGGRDAREMFHEAGELTRPNVGLEEIR